MISLGFLKGTYRTLYLYAHVGTIDIGTYLYFASFHGTYLLKT